MSVNRPWGEIRQRYAQYDTEAARAMLELVVAIEASAYASGLYGWTSMMDLCITQTRVEYPYNGPYLRVSPKPAGLVEFRYHDTFDETKQWHRTVVSSQAFARLERFLDQLHWFPKQAD